MPGQHEMLLATAAKTRLPA